MAYMRCGSNKQLKIQPITYASNSADTLTLNNATIGKTYMIVYPSTVGYLEQDELISGLWYTTNNSFNITGGVLLKGLTKMPVANSSMFDKIFFVKATSTQVTITSNAIGTQASGTAIGVELD